MRNDFPDASAAPSRSIASEKKGLEFGEVLREVLDLVPGYVSNHLEETCKRRLDRAKEARRCSSSLNDVTNLV